MVVLCNVGTLVFGVIIELTLMLLGLFAHLLTNTVDQSHHDGNFYWRSLVFLFDFALIGSFLEMLWEFGKHDLISMYTSRTMADIANTSAHGGYGEGETGAHLASLDSFSESASAAGDASSTVGTPQENALVYMY